MNDGTEYSWSPPQYDISRLPSLEGPLEIPADREFPENFARTAKWCPDGSAVIAQCENMTFQLFNPVLQTVSLTQNLPTIQTIRQPSPILDFIWYPTATPQNPASFCFVASVRECPVKLLDASDGRLRASYRIVDHRERQIAPHSLAFNLSADKLYCGFEDAIEVFDVLYPGEGTRLATTPSKKSKDGLKGIISALSFSPSYESDFYAAGSLSPSSSNIAMFSESQGEGPIMLLGGGIRAGVTQLHFNPVKPHILYASFRRHEAIYSWDLRADVGAPMMMYSKQDDKPIVGGTMECNANRSELTNQKMRFDVDLGGRWLGVGDQKGHISVFDLNSTENVDAEKDSYLDGVSVVSPTLTFRAHGDAVGSVAFHPLQSLLLSVSGSRHFHPEDEDNKSSSSSDSSEDDEGEEVEAAVEGREQDVTGVRRRRQRPHPLTLDASIKMWNFQGARLSSE